MQKNDWPFDIWLDLAVRVFGLTPKQFWATSLTDWLVLLSSARCRLSEQPLTQQKLTGLIDQFPDVEN